MKQLIRRFFSLFGLEVKRKNSAISTLFPSKPGRDTMQMALLRLQQNDFSPSVVIDLGAAAGTWTEKALPYFPKAQFLMFEPLLERRDELLHLADRFPIAQPVFAAVGNREGKVNFVVSEDLDGSGVYDAIEGGGNREVDLVTLDGEWSRRKLSGSCLLKFDTHGFEIPILEGATEVLKHTTIIIMECYNFKIASQSLYFGEMVSYMDKLGFRPSDVVDIMRRPDDKVLWQFDLVFLRKDHPFFSRNTYL